MPESEAVYHMKRCIDSGLWVPEANKSKDAAEASTNEDSEGEYQELTPKDAAAGSSGDKST